MTEGWDIFISHASKDKPVVGILVKDLQQSGLSVWYDESSIKLGDRLRDRINEGIKNSTTVIIVISTNSLRSQWVLNELDSAMLREISEKKSIVIPILIGRVKTDDLPQDLQGKKFLDLRYNFDSKYNSKRNELIQRVSLTCYAQGESLESETKEDYEFSGSLTKESLDKLPRVAVIAFSGQCLNRAMVHFNQFKGNEVGTLPDVVLDAIQLATHLPDCTMTISEVIDNANRAVKNIGIARCSPKRCIDSIYDDTDPVEDALFDAAEEIVIATVNVAEAVACAVRSEIPVKLVAEAVRRTLRAASHCCDARLFQRYVEDEDRQRALALYGQFVRAIDDDFDVQRRTARQ